MASPAPFKLKMSKPKWAIVGLLSIFFLLSDNFTDVPELETNIRNLDVTSTPDDEEEQTPLIQCSFHQEDRAPGSFIKSPDCTSDGNQDEILQRIFNTIGIQNYRCVEAGFSSSSNPEGLVLPDFARNETNEVLKEAGLNTHALIAKGWTPTFFDDKFENTDINLHKKLLTPDNIAEAFKEVGLPTDVDYVSIDVDSVDVWLMQGLLGNGYKPRVISAKYNANFPLDMPMACEREWAPFKSRSRVYGASASALNLVAAMHGYQVVEVMFSSRKTDMFFVRKDILQKKCIDSSIASFEYLTEGLVGRPFQDFCYKEDAERLVDFPLAMMGLEKQAKEKALKQIKELNGIFQEEHSFPFCILG